VTSTLAACDDDGPCTAFGHARRLSAAGAALVNGTAAHGEDFDDTFEGGPVHAGAVIVPAVTPRLVHNAGFHPTAVFGAMAAAAGVATALKLDRRAIVDALGIAGSRLPASSNILPRAHGRSGCTRAGRRNPVCAQP
jgi:2-methylcitrate dehydratase PrpD